MTLLSEKNALIDAVVAIVVDAVVVIVVLPVGRTTSGIVSSFGAVVISFVVGRFHDIKNVPIPTNNKNMILLMMVVYFFK